MVCEGEVQRGDRKETEEWNLERFRERESERGREGDGERERKARVEETVIKEDLGEGKGVKDTR